MSVAASGSSGPREPRPGPPRILLISNMWPGRRDPVFGVFVSRHVRALRDLGASVRVIASTEPRSGRLMTPFKYASLAVRALAATTHGPYDVVVGHFLYPTAAVARLAARVMRVPLVLVAHGTDVRSIQRSSAIARASRNAVRRADLLVAVSNALALRLTDAVGSDVSARVAVVDMGVDTAVFEPNEHARASLGVPAEERLVLYAGKLVQVKGVDVLLDAFALVRAKAAADRLVLIGSGPLESTLRERARALGIAQNVEFRGQVPQSELAAWMAAADVFVLPSRDEGLGLVLLEAMACGTPCVATKVGGIPETLSSGCGRLVEPERPGDLAEAIAEVVSVGKATMTDACMHQAAPRGVDEQARRFLFEIERVVST